MESNKYSKAFVKAVTDLAKTIELDVCAEGIEENNQVDSLDKINVNLAQGFYFDKPLTKEEFGKKYI